MKLSTIQLQPNDSKDMEIFKTLCLVVNDLEFRNSQYQFFQDNAYMFDDGNYDKFSNTDVF